MKHNAHIVVGMAYGDEGKGATVDLLVRKRNAGLVVRFNGGPQALHNVVTPDGRHHSFAQFGSGTFVPGVRTHLSKFMLVDPMALVTEADELRKVGVLDALQRISVDPRALIITPFQREVNRILAIGVARLKPLLPILRHSADRAVKH
jgi:adenylosuccinate synthase